jgi:hypothetical protein
VLFLHNKLLGPTRTRRCQQTALLWSAFSIRPTLGRRGKPTALVTLN